MFSKFRKGLKTFVEKKVRTCEEVLSSAQNRLILGLLATGLGVGLIASAYIRAPQ